MYTMKKLALLFLMALFLAGAACLPMSRALASTYTVTTTVTTATSGNLHWAIEQANGNPGTDIIDFDIPTGEASSREVNGETIYYYYMTTTEAMPAITEAVMISGETQAENHPTHTNPYGPEIILDGGSAPGGHGLRIQTNNCLIKELGIQTFHESSGFYITGDNNTIYGCHIGVQVTGEADAMNRYGIYIYEGDQNVIGGSGSSQRNIISGNDYYGVYIEGTGGNYADSNQIIGNYIGTNRDGTRAVANGDYGIFMYDYARSCQIGGSGVGEGNVISGNSSHGIRMGAFGGGTYVYENDILGNKIGTTSNGATALPNGGNGIHIDYGAHDNNIGDGTAGGRNIISGNTANGIDIRNTGADNHTIRGNYIGVDVTGEAALGNGACGVGFLAAPDQPGPQNTTIEGNVISANDSGVVISANCENTEIYGNFIGTNKDGTVDRGNTKSGVTTSSHYTKIGNTSGGGNVISGNGWIGVDMNFGSSSNEVIGNKIGTNADGTAAIPNVLGGVEISGGGGHNLIGSTEISGRNIISGNTAVGVGIKGCSHNQILGNYIGTTANGESPLANQSQGVAIGPGTTESSTYNEIRNNVISGNASAGVYIYGSGASLMANHNRVLGNIIGLDKNGASDLGNAGHGVVIGDYSEYNIIGSKESSGRNIISKNGDGGIELAHSNCRYNQVLGNFIGTDISGTLDRGNTTTGVRMYIGASYNLIGSTESDGKNIISGNDSFGLSIQGTAGNICEHNQVFGNYIGTTSNGAGALGNGGTGIIICEYSQHNKIGDGTSAGRNVIAANVEEGISIYGTENGSNEVLANYIGTDKDGTLALNASNAFANTGKGIGLESDHNECFQNIISGNGESGIDISDDADYNQCMLNIIYGNAEDGVGIAENSNYNLVSENSIEANSLFGVAIDETSNYNQISENIISWSGFPGVWIIGSSEANQIGPGNTIAYNGLEETAAQLFHDFFLGYGFDLWPPGVMVMGDSAGGARTIYNTITQNSIYGNRDLGILLLDEGNQEIAAPTIASIAFNQATGTAEVAGTSGVGDTVELFNTNGPDPSGSGEGKVYLGSAEADGSGDWYIPLLSLTPYSTISATATDTSGNTSMFSVNKIAYLDVEGLLVRVDIPWETSNWPGGRVLTVECRVWEGTPIKTFNIYHSTDEGTTYPDTPNVATNESITPTDSIHYKYSWHIPFMNATSSMLKVIAWDQSSRYGTAESGWFAITTVPPELSISRPAADESIKGGEQKYPVTYAAASEVGFLPMTVRYSTNESVGWQLMTTAEDGDGVCPWDVPTVDSENCYISIEAEELSTGAVVRGLSGKFTIDSTSPEVVESTPADGDTDVARDTTIEITFSEEMDQSSVYGAFHLVKIEGMREMTGGSYTWEDSNTLKFTPPTDLWGDETVYALSVEALAKDLVGNALVEAYAASFTTTAERGERVPPQIQILVNGEGIQSGTPENPEHIDSPMTIEAIVTDNYQLDLNDEQEQAGVRMFWYREEVTPQEVTPQIIILSITEVHAKHEVTGDLEEGNYIISVEATDAAGNVSIEAVTGLTVDAGGATAFSIISYPGTFSPKKGEVATLAYMLSKHTDLTIYLYAPSGEIVWTRKFASGSMGGKAGYNAVAFDGKSDITGTTVGNGIYVGKLIGEGRQIGKLYIVVFD